MTRSRRIVMHVAYCTNQASLNSYRKATVDGLKLAGHEVSLVHTIDEAARFPAGTFDVGILQLYRVGADVYSRLNAWQAALLLEALGVHFLNSLFVWERSRDRLVTRALFRARGLPVPIHWTQETLPESYPYPVVVKPIYGSRGIGVKIAENAAEAREYAHSLGVPTLFQERLNGPGYRVIATDKRAIMGFEIPGAMAEIATESFTEARVDLARLPDDIATMAVEMTRAVGGSMLGCDIGSDETGELYAVDVEADFSYQVDTEVIVPAMIELLQHKVELLEQAAAFF